MSLAVPTPQEYRDALDRLAREHARRVELEAILSGAERPMLPSEFTDALERERAKAERFRALYEAKVRTKVLHNDVHTQDEARLILAAISPDPPMVTEARRAAICGDPPAVAALEFLVAPHDSKRVTKARLKSLEDAA